MSSQLGMTPNSQLNGRCPMDPTDAMDLILLLASIGTLFCAGMFFFELGTRWTLPSSTLDFHDFNPRRKNRPLPTDKMAA